MTDLKKQLEEANKAIRCLMIKGSLEEVTGYRDKYLKPVDLLKGEIIKLAYNYCVPQEQLENFYNKLTEILKEELNGTKGLDKLIEWMTKRLSIFRTLARKGSEICEEHRWLEIIMLKACTIRDELES